MKVLILGATSAIAEAAARRWAGPGARFYLVARRAELLAAIAADLMMRGADAAAWESLDLVDIHAHEAMLLRAVGSMQGIDCVLVAHGNLPDQTDCETSVESMMRAVDVNGLSTIALLTLVARHFELQRRGTIVVITSVAGDRGRQSNYVYGAAKALVSAFASGLRQRLSKVGVRVVDVRPGFVDTPMTAAISKGALWASPDRVARDIVAAAKAGTAVVYTPWFWRWIMCAIRWLPQALFNKLTI